jgi:uncharacterized membrane protein
MSHKHPVNKAHHEDLTLSLRIAEAVAKNMGSMRFIVIQTILIALWIALNLTVVVMRWDPYPFILLNLVFSTQAAYAAPFIMLSQNRQSEKDRAMAEFDFRHNAESLALLRALHADAHGADCTKCIADIKDD